jgi:hypothetical protein
MMWMQDHLHTMQVCVRWLSRAHVTLREHIASPAAAAAGHGFFAAEASRGHAVHGLQQLHMDHC